MRILVLGGTGMLGSYLVRLLAPQHEVISTVRQNTCPILPTGVRGYASVDVTDDAKVRNVLTEVRPDLVVNAAGIVKQLAKYVSVEDFIAVNAAFPHRLARMLSELGGRLIHVSTDCVFSGTKGGYLESDTPDPVDVYGMSKLLGEPSGDHVTVLRTSIVGLETVEFGKTPHGLVEWALRQVGPLEGFRKSIFSGLTVKELSRAIETIASDASFSGLWHIASAPISKHDLLSGLERRLPENRLNVRAVDGPSVNRSLDGSRIVQASGYHVPSWELMLDELAEDIKVREERAV